MLCADTMGFRAVLRPGKRKRRNDYPERESSRRGQCGPGLYQGYLFLGRPSAADYKADSSAGSNKGPTNEAYLAEVEARVDSFLVHHPYLERKDVPAEMVTASGSGLDPHITPACAYVQVKRVAEARGMNEETVKALVDKMVEKPFLGLFGTEKVNVLKLNVALEEANPTVK